MDIDLKTIKRAINRLSIKDYVDQIDDILKKYETVQDNEKFSKITKKKHFGIYYTNFKTAYKITEETLKSSPKNIHKFKFYEPCVGLGVFVITYIEYVIRNYNLDLRKISQLLNNIYISDIDKEAVALCKKLISKYVKIRLNIDFDLPRQNIYVGNVVHDENYCIKDPNSIFGKKILFDIILTNPPFRNLKATLKEFSQESISKFRDYYRSISLIVRKNLSLQQGTLNLYKIFLELIYKRLTHDSSFIGVIVPSTLLSDYTSTDIRKFIFQNSKIDKIFLLSEKSNEFKSGTQSMCYFGSCKSENVKNKISFIQDDDIFHATDFDLAEIKNINNSYAIIKLNQIALNILKKIHNNPKLKDIAQLYNLRGELDLTLDKNYICNEKTKYKLIQGKHISEWKFKDNDKFVNKNFVLNKAASKMNFVKKSRIVCHQISNALNNKRLKFSKIPPKYILGNSCNFIVTNNEHMLDYYLGIMNSYLLDWRFNLFSSNNHINNYELDDLPICINARNEEKIKKYVYEIVNGNYEKIIDLNILVFQIYKLEKNEILEILSNYNDKYSIKLRKIFNEMSRQKVKIYNHTINKVSDLDMRMILSIPEGGNWKNIPSDIPSKRLERIRKSGGRTTYYGRLRWDKPSYTIGTYFTRPGNGTYIHPNDSSSEQPIHRLITPREAARLQSFPDNFKFFGSKSSITDQIGNAVPPLLAFVVAKEIKENFRCNNMISLFCGAGGLSLGFKKAGYNIILANDHSAHAGNTYEFNNPDTDFVLGDISLDETKMKLFAKTKHKRIDIICGGPPCQGFSTAGKRLSDDPRNFLFKEFVGIVKELKPKIFIIENVLGILSSDEGKTYKSILEEFSTLGYSITSQILNAVNFGIPQRRKRVILVGSLEKKYFFEISPIISEEKNFVTVKDAISNLVDVEPHATNAEIECSIKPRTLYQEYLSEKISMENYLNSLSNLEEIRFKTLFNFSKPSLFKPSEISK